MHLQYSYACDFHEPGSTATFFLDGSTFFNKQQEIFRCFLLTPPGVYTKNIQGMLWSQITSVPSMFLFQVLKVLNDKKHPATARALYALCFKRSLHWPLGVPDR